MVGNLILNAKTLSSPTGLNSTKPVFADVSYHYKVTYIEQGFDSPNIKNKWE